MAQATQLCQMLSFSCEMPVNAVMGFALAPRILVDGQYHHISRREDKMQRTSKMADMPGP